MMVVLPNTGVSGLWQRKSHDLIESRCNSDAWILPMTCAALPEEIRDPP